MSSINTVSPQDTRFRSSSEGDFSDEVKSLTANKSSDDISNNKKPTSTIWRIGKIERTSKKMAQINLEMTDFVSRSSPTMETKKLMFPHHNLSEEGITKLGELAIEILQEVMDNILTGEKAKTFPNYLNNKLIVQKEKDKYSIKLIYNTFSYDIPSSKIEIPAKNILEKAQLSYFVITVSE